MLTMGTLRENWFQISSMLASFMLVWGTLERFISRVLASFNPYINISFDECVGATTSEAYAAIETYLGSKSIDQAKGLQGHLVKGTKKLVITLRESEQVYDDFRGIKLRWEKLSKPQTQSTGNKDPVPEERSYQLTFRNKDKAVVLGEYLSHVLEEAEIKVRYQQRKLYSNLSYMFQYKKLWTHIEFKHPSTFDTLAMDGTKKEEIMNDLIAFREGKEYYAKMGKAWKRGYLLYGPPGTGKSTLIAAIANFMEYDIYDLELTAVMSNLDLRKLLVETTSKSLIVIEDIDCSVDLTGVRKEKKAPPEATPEKQKNDPTVTLSGLLNFIDGLWSACGSERIIIFTTNYIDKLDPALIRRGRMDLHIEMSYCTFEPFKVLAKNYTDLEYHPLFDKIEELLGQVDISTADVGEILMLKSKKTDAMKRLEELIEILEAAKTKKQEQDTTGIKKLERESSMEEGEDASSSVEQDV